MVIPDYDSMFDMLDISSTGYLSIDQLQEFQTEIFYSPLDVRQIRAALRTVYGRETDGKCTREYFGSVVEEIGRRVLLEESIAWDFKSLDVNGTGRISLSAALLLFKCVHGDYFSFQTWNNFLSSRSKCYADVSFDDIKLWLCHLPVGGPCEDDEFLVAKTELEINEIDEMLREWDELDKMQEDSFVIAERESARNNESLKLKQKSKQTIRRLEKEGIDALLYDVDSDVEEDDGRKTRKQVGATDLLNILKTKYEVLREKLLIEQLQHDTGEGVWSALSHQQQQERLVHLKLKERRLSASDMDTVVLDKTATVKYKKNLLALLGCGRMKIGKILKNDDERRTVLENQGKTENEIHNMLHAEWKKQLEGSSDNDKMMKDICKRYQDEKEILKNRMKGDKESPMTVSNRLQLFKMLFREQLKASLESNFETACLVIGVSETYVNSDKVDRFHFGKELQMQLAEHILIEKRGRKLLTEFNQPQLRCHDYNGNVVEYFEDIVKTLERKHRAEVEMLVHMLQGNESAKNRSEVKKMTPDERDNQFLVIKMQHQNWRNHSSEEKLEAISCHLQYLQEAVSILCVNRRQEMDKAGSEKTVAVSLLSQLLRQQESDTRIVVADKEQSLDDLSRVRQEQEQMYREGWLENLSAVVLGTSDITRVEDDVIKLLDDKYDVIRHKILEEALKDQTGVEDWDNTPLAERYNLVTKAKMNEKMLRMQKRFDDALKMLGDGFMSGEKFMSFLGESRQKFMERLKGVLEKRRDQMSEGLEPECGEIEETTVTSSGNLWKDLDDRYKKEKIMLIRKLQEGGSSGGDFHDMVLRLMQQKRVADREPNMLCSLLVLGLYERHRRIHNEHLLQDKGRRQLLTEEQFVLMRLARNLEEKEIEDSVPSDDEPSEWMDVVLREVERKQRLEKSYLSSLLLNNAALEDVRNEAITMSEDERQKRLSELHDERETLDLDEKGDHDMNMTILEMACGFKIESRKQRLQASKKDERITDDAVFLSLLFDLHERHNDECEEILEEIVEKSKDELSQLLNKQINAYKSEHMNNIALILMRYDGVGSNDDILSALEKKYDALKDKLLLEELKKQLGQYEWNRLSEKERQLRLMKLKLEAKRLKKENKLDELAKLLGEGFENDVNLRRLLGANREKYEEQLKEKLARRRERLAKGLPEESDEEDELDGGLSTGQDILQALENRFEDERDALMAKLLGANNQFLSEKERQALLARLKREQMKAKLEDKFDSAALVLGLAERQRKNAEERLKSDRARHEELARQRLADRQKRRNQKILNESDIVTNGDLSAMQEGVIKMLENKHFQEREILTSLLENEVNTIADIAISMTSEQREEHITALKQKKTILEKSDKKQHEDILQEAAIMKYVSRQQTLKMNKCGEDIAKNEVIISLLADLQQEQDKESEVLMTLLQDKDQSELVALQSRLLAEANSEKRTNLMVIFDTPEQVTIVGEQQLVAALDAKYDILRDKLLSEAMMKEMGMAEWNALSEQERQARLVKIKLEEKRLRREGKLDELQKLLGTAFATEANLQEVMGQNKARYKERMKEKLEKRRQRLKEGMSKDEVAKLEAEEDEQFEDEMKQEANGNPLADLMNCYDKEKEALLSALRNKDSRFASERQRQAELARLRREERKARHEDKYDTAALVLGLAQAQKTTLEDIQKKDRLRQEQLARERLAARRKKRSDELQSELLQKEHEEMEEINDKDNLVALQEAVLKELEKKQECERDFLQTLLQDEEKSELRKDIENQSCGERNERLVELKKLRQQWRDSEADGTVDSMTEHNTILREAVCLNVVSTKEELQSKNDKEIVGEEDVHVVILAKLQQLQDQEAEMLLQDLSNKTVTTLTQLQAVQHQSRRFRVYDNIATALLGQSTATTTREHGIPSEDELLNALEEKYDALKDKLIAESLMKDLGVAEWEKLSERERQAKIMKIRLQEKKLRKEGKFDEANRLFGESLEHAASLSKLMGETKAEQKDALRRRLQKLRELKEAGVEMTTEEVQLLEDGLEDDQNEDVTTEDVMKGLQAQYEEEKKALLASLSGQDKRFGSERQRQLELAKLRREQKKIAKEDKFDAAALVLGLAKQQAEAKETSFRKTHERHKQLARERLAALKKKRGEKQASLLLKTEEEQRNYLERQLEQEGEMENASLSQEILKIEKGGLVAIHEAIMKDIEKKHSLEIKMLTDLLDVCDKDSEATAAASYLNIKQRSDKLNKIYNDYKNWKNTTIQASKNIGSDLTKEEQEQNILRIADNRMKLIRILRDGIVYKIMNMKESWNGIHDGVMEDELSIQLMASLQERQTTEDRAVENILAEKDGETLSRIKDEQRRNRQESILDNLASVLLQEEIIEGEDLSEMSQVEEENMKQLEEDMNAELEEKRRMLSGASEAEILAAMNEIRRQQEAKKEAMNKSHEYQRNLAKAKLEARRRKKNDKQYEEDVAASLLKMAEQESSLVREKTMIQRSKQGESLQERLARRRDERAKRLAQEEQERIAKEQENNAVIETPSSSPETASTNGAGENVSDYGKKTERFVETTTKLKDNTPSLPDGFTMRREKTVVDVEVSEDKKKEIIGSLLREHTTVGMGFERERRRQEDNMRERRFKKKSTVAAAAATIVGLGERQKTMVEQKQKEERDRQLTMVRNRITRVRHERTMTMKEPRAGPKGFDHILSQEEAEGLSAEDKMKLIASKMEQKFKVEQRSASILPSVEQPSTSSAHLNSESVTADAENASVVRLDEKGKERKLKDRLAARKRAKKEGRSGNQEDNQTSSSTT